MKISVGVFWGMLAVTGLGVDAAAQPKWHNLDAGEYAVGFSLSRERDDTRVLAGAPRPVRVWMWYPAVSSPGATPMRFVRYASLADGDAWPVESSSSIPTKLSFARHALARSLGPEGFEALGRQSVRAFENAEPLEGPFPLIVLGQGLYYESPITFAALSEYLAGRGFVVATCPLVGTRAPLVKLDVEDLQTQVRDLEVVIARARELPYVDPDELGVVGFDMGGMAGLILAMRHRSVDAFASIPAGILLPHPSGLPQSSPDYDPLDLRVPWLHVGHLLDESTSASATTHLLGTAMHSERFHLQIEGLEHVDSTSYALVEGRKALQGYWPAWEKASLERHEILARHVYEFFAAFLQHRPESLAYLNRENDAERANHPLVMEHRSASPESITYEQLVDALLTGDGTRAVEQVRSLRATEPSSALLSDFILYRLTYSLLYSWGLADEAMQVSQLNVELNPASTLAARGLSMSHVHRGDYAAAVAVYERLLEKRPDDDEVRRTLEWLRQQEQSNRRH